MQDWFRIGGDHNGVAVAEDDPVDEPAVHAARRDGEHPRRDVADAPAAGEPRVAGGRGRDHPAPHGVEGADGRRVPEVAQREQGPDGLGDDVDAVDDGIVERREHVGVGAVVLPAHLVDGEPGARHGAARGAGGQATEADVTDRPAGRGGRRVAAVPVLVERGQAGAGSLIVGASTDDLAEK